MEGGLHCTISYKRFKHPQILASAGVLEPTPNVLRKLVVVVSLGRRERLGVLVWQNLTSLELFRTAWMLCQVCVTFPIKTANQKMYIETDAHDTLSEKSSCKKRIRGFSNLFCLHLYLKKRNMRVSVILNDHITVFLFSHFWLISTVYDDQVVII